MVLDDHVAGQRGLRAHDEVVADDAVVRDVRVGQQHVVVAEDGELARLGRAVHADVLAEHVAVADAQAGIAAGVLQIVGLGANAGEGKHLALLADRRPALDVGVVVEDAAVADGSRAGRCTNRRR
ncbi:MAG: hypothetical protein WDM96_01770 [Lacunisphaera sp.]